jgi:hypothetical protein
LACFPGKKKPGKARSILLGTGVLSGALRAGSFASKLHFDSLPQAKSLACFPSKKKPGKARSILLGTGVLSGALRAGSFASKLHFDSLPQAK